MTCVFHAYAGDPPCPWCSEAAGLVLRERWEPPPFACQRCGSPDTRRNEAADPPYRWCGACGGKP